MPEDIRASISAYDIAFLKGFHPTEFTVYEDWFHQGEPNTLRFADRSDKTNILCSYNTDEIFLPSS